MRADLRDTERARVCFRLWYFSYSLLVTHAFYVWSIAHEGQASWHGAIPFLVYYPVGIIAGRLLSKARAFRNQSVFWEKHWWAVWIGPLGGFLWAASLLSWIALHTMLSFQIFFFPLYAFGELNPWFFDVWGYAAVLLGVPAQYLAIGAVADVLRRATKHAGR